MRSVAGATLLLVLTTGCPGDEPAWSEVLDGDDLDRVVLSAWGTSSSDVYVVGGGLGNGLGAIALHYDGDAWTEIDTGAAASFWWVWGAASDDVYFVGEGGTIVHWNGTTADTQTTPTTVTLFGVWGASAGDVWAVGGDAVTDPPTSVILHLEAGAWVDATPATVPDGALFKVWGTAANDIYAVGQNGIILHYNGSAWVVEDSDTSVSLFTVSGGDGIVWAVGGGPATVVRSQGAGAWLAEDTGIPAGVLNGVSVTPDGEVLVVGMGGVKMRRGTDGAWSDETFEPPFRDLHAVFAELDGHVYAVGGNFNAPGGGGVVRIGIVGYYGKDAPATEVD